MSIWIRRGLQLTALSAGMIALGAGIASASDSGPHLGGDLLGSGTALSAPVSITGTAVSVLSGDVAVTGQSLDDGGAPSSDTALITAPVVVQDTAIVLGSDTASNGTTATPTADADGAGTAPAGSAFVSVGVGDTAVTVLGHADAARTDDSATRADTSVVDAPVTVCGTTAAVFGEGTSTCADQPGASGTSLISAPVTVCGTSAAAAGEATSTCADQPDASGAAWIGVPVNVCGTSLAAFGQARFGCSTFAASSSTPLTSVDSIPTDVPEVVGNEVAPAGPQEQPITPAGTRPEPGIVQPAAANESLSPTAGLAYTGMNLMGTLAAGALMLVLGAGGAIGAHRRGNGLTGLAG